jgi:hypothetical protein
MNRQEARKRKLAEAGIVSNFEKVGYVVSQGHADTRSTFERLFHAEKIKSTA